MKDEALQMAILFDFFGNLLTEKKRDFFDLYYNEDFSLSEISEMAGITRQGVYDHIRHAESQLLDIERKTGIVSKWQESRTELERAGEIAHKLLQLSGDNEEVADLVKELVHTLETQKNM